MTNKPLLGELLVTNDLVSQEIIDQALRLQIGGNRRLGHILVRMKAITDDQLAEVLADQLGITITEVGTQFSPEVKKVLPRYLCNRYGVLPLRFKSNNILEVAMANPSDQEAINDIEHYTGRVVEPRLARHSDIDKVIPKCIPLGWSDFLSPKVNTMANRIIATLALACVFGLGVYTYDYVRTANQGTISVSTNYTLYQHHDLTLAVSSTGSYSLQGHAAFSDGLYDVSFYQLNSLSQFIDNHATEMSTKQLDWLKWAIGKAASRNNKQMVAQN